MARRQVEGWTDKTRRLAVGVVDEVRSAFVDEGLGAAFDVLKKHGISIPCGPTLVKWGFQGLGVSWRRVQELNRLKKEILLGEQGRSVLRTASQELADVIVSLSLREIPVIIAIEDMHLMGRELPAFLDAVSSRRSSPVLVVGTVWPEGENSGVYRRWLNKAQNLGGAQRIKIPMLGSGELSSMIQEEAPRTSEEDLLWISDRLNSPFLIRLWLSERRTWEHIEGHHGAVVLKDEGFWLPEDVMAVLKGRWDELDGAVSLSVLYAAAISPDVDGSACRFVSEVVVGVINRRGEGVHYDVRMGLRRAIEKLCWCRSEQGVEFFVEPLLAEFLRRKADGHFGKQGWRQLRLLTQDALAEWICHRAEGVYLHPTEVSIFVCRWFLGLDEGGQSEELILARAAAQWCLAQNADSCDEVDDAVEHGKKALAALLMGNPLSEKVMLNVRATVADYVLRGGVVKDALNRYSALLPAFERAFGIHHPRTLLVRYGRAKAMAGSGRLEDGAAELRSLLEDQSAVLGSGHPDSWATRSNLVELLNCLGRTEESLALCNDGGDVPESDSVEHDLLPVGFVRTMALMGDKHEGVAVGVCRDLLGDMERKFGSDHQNVLEARSNLAVALCRDSQLGEAVAEYRLLVQGYGRVLGSDHPSTLTTRHNLARALRDAGRVEEAIEAFRAVLTDHLRVLGPDHPNTLITRGNLAAALQSAGRVEEAIGAYQAVLTDHLRVLGPDHPNTLATRRNLAVALQSAGRVKQAIEAYRAVLTDQFRVQGPNHPDTLLSRDNLVEMLNAVGRCNEAVLVYQSILEARLSSADPDDPDVLDARDDLAWALGRAKRFDEALAGYMKLIVDYERVMGVDDPDTLTARNNYICTLKNSGKIMEAVALYRELLSDVERILGADDEFAQEIAQRLSEWES